MRRAPDAEATIRDLVDRETAAWDRQDADALVELFHPDMVWPWPAHERGHDPATWIMPMGRFDAVRWRATWQELFDTHELVHNRRTTQRVAVTEQGDGGFAVVDIDTKWRNRADGVEQHWCGRVCKVYTRLADGSWKLVMHTGVLVYD